jgi:CheY-like chemotaxis protein
MAKIGFCEVGALIQRMLQAAMRDTPHTVFVAADAVQGLALVERERPDLLSNGVWMPHMDGYQFADTLRARRELAQIPIVPLTAASEPAKLEEGHRRGAVDVVLKPSNAASLCAKVDVLLNSAQP